MLIKTSKFIDDMDFRLHILKLIEKGIDENVTVSLKGSERISSSLITALIALDLHCKNKKFEMKIADVSEHMISELTKFYPSLKFE